MRQEGKGVLIGHLRAGLRVWSPDATPWDFSMQLLPDDLDRHRADLEIGFKHFPAVGRAGIKKVVNGPFTFAPDGNPLVGPVRGLRELLVRLRRDGRIQRKAAASAWRCRDWMAEGDPGCDVFAMDVARFGASRRRAYTNVKVQENYRRRFRIAFPNEELPAARPLRRTPVYDRLQAAGRRVRRQLRARARALVCAEGHGARRDADLPPLQCLPASCAKNAIAVRNAVGIMEIIGLRQV